MKCPECKRKFPKEDFFWKDTCYKCQYAEKLKVLKTLKPCRICKKMIPRGRWTFCSKECAKEGKDYQNKTYWTSNIKCEKTKWNEFRF